MLIAGLSTRRAIVRYGHVTFGLHKCGAHGWEARTITMDGYLTIDMLGIRTDCESLAVASALATELDDELILRDLTHRSYDREELDS